MVKRFSTRLIRSTYCTVATYVRSAMRAKSEEALGPILVRTKFAQNGDFGSDILQHMPGAVDGLPNCLFEKFDNFVFENVFSRSSLDTTCISVKYCIFGM